MKIIRLAPQQLHEYERLFLDFWGQKSKSNMQAVLNFGCWVSQEQAKARKLPDAERDPERGEHDGQR